MRPRRLTNKEKSPESSRNCKIDGSIKQYRLLAEETPPIALLWMGKEQEAIAYVGTSIPAMQQRAAWSFPPCKETDDSCVWIRKQVLQRHLFLGFPVPRTIKIQMWVMKAFQSMVFYLNWNRLRECLGGIWGQTILTCRSRRVCYQSRHGDDISLLKKVLMAPSTIRRWWQGSEFPHNEPGKEPLP